MCLAVCYLIIHRQSALGQGAEFAVIHARGIRRDAKTDEISAAGTDLVCFLYGSISG